MRRWWALIGLCACGSTPTASPSDAGADVHDASDARACSKQPATLTTGMPGPAIAVDDTDVYWIDTRDPSNVLERTPKAGGPTSDVASDVVSFTVDANDVYYGVLTYGDGGSTKMLYALTKADAGAPIVVASNTAGIGLTLDATTLYFLDSGSVESVPKTGGTPQPITSGPTATALVGVDDVSAYWISSTTSTATIWATPKTSGANVQIAQVPPTIQRTALDGGDIYYTTSKGELVKVSIATSTVTTLASDLGLYGGFNLAARSGFAFVDQQHQGQYPAIILAVPADGGIPQDTCAGGSMSISGIAVDDAQIYWGLIYEASGQLMKIPR